ncbi:uncharacterized protein LOC129308391 [Prosopis cineraria]|uniref:uncharacterized protein LOC129308391 n=1 Tax=Prosopis cineraria TaxID=364024 RepID=UPI00240EF9DA|nr:uncharacterized protein LOC129308391 [Prosopis cineraria]
MSSKHPQRRAIISKDGDEDDKSLYNCARKYDMIVKQFDELMGIMNNPTSIPKSTRSRKVSASGTSMAASSSQPESNGALAEAVTRFLHELRVSPTDSGFSSSTCKVVSKTYEQGS